MTMINGIPEEEFIEDYKQCIDLMNNPEECELTIDELGGYGYADEDKDECEADEAWKTERYNEICSNYWYQLMKQRRREYREETGKSLPWPLPYV